MAKYFFLVLALPFVELYLLLTIGRRIGVAPTLGLLLAAGLVGSWLAKKEGLRVLRKWQSAHAEGRVPEEGLISAALVWVGGVLLIIPGFLTDAMGLFLLLPPARRWLSGRFRRGVERRMREGSLRVTTVGGTFRSERVAEPPRPVLEEKAGKSLGEVDAEFTEDGPKP